MYLGDISVSISSNISQHSVKRLFSYFGNFYSVQKQIEMYLGDISVSISSNIVRHSLKILFSYFGNFYSVQKQIENVLRRYISKYQFKYSSAFTKEVIFIFWKFLQCTKTNRKCT